MRKGSNVESVVRAAKGELAEMNEGFEPLATKLAEKCFISNYTKER